MGRKEIERKQSPKEFRKVGIAVNMRNLLEMTLNRE
jgi:hypothetical protein